MFGMKKIWQRADDRIRSLEEQIEGMKRDIAFLQRASPRDVEVAAEGHNMHNIPQVAISGRRFSVVGYPVLSRDEPVLFSDPDNAVFLGVGWWGTEPWGTWGRGRSELRFCVGEGYLGGYLEARLGIQARPPVDEGQRPTLRIVANGFFLGNFATSGACSSLRVRLPPAAVADGNILLVLDYSDPQKPPAVGDNPDLRTIGVGIVSLLLP